MSNKNKKKNNDQRIGDLIAGAGKSLSAKDLQQIAKKSDYTPASIIKRAEKAGVEIKPSAQDFVQQAVQAQVNQQQQQAIANAPANTTAAFDYTPQGTIASVTYNPISSSITNQTPSTSAAAGATVSEPTAYLEEIKAANALSLQNLMNQGSAYGWDTQKEINRVSEAAETERTKLLNENRLAVTDAESRGRLDLQKIVNAGMRNIANIERGSRMAAGIYSMFNF